MFEGSALLAILLSASAVHDAAKWKALNATVQGRLFNGIPFARPCFQQAAPGTLGNFSAEGCAAVTAEYLDSPTLASSFGAYVETQWETCQRTGASCLLDNTNPNNSVADAPPKVCSQGAIPDYAIDVSNAQDIIAAFRFSKANGIPLTIKNTGHDYKGRASGPGTLALWTHNLKSLRVEKKFVPQHCPKTTVGKLAVTIGAGVQWSDIVEFGDQNKLTIPTGGCATVGAGGGYVQGGGHSILSNVLGLGVDRVLEFEIVTPTGDHLFVNECSSPDLFWALRGGGGGTFGVVLKVTTLVFPEMPINAVFASYDPTVGDNRLKFLQFITKNYLELARQGWGSYIVADTITLANPKLTARAANASTAALQKFIASIGGSFTASLEPNHKSFFDKYLGVIHWPSGFPFAMSSRLIPADNFKTARQRNELSTTLDSLMGKIDLVAMLGVTPFVYGDNNNTSVTPAWRNSLWHVTLGAQWNFDASVQQVSSIYTDLTESANILRAMTPGSGAYQSEADVYEPDFEESFYGGNYPRLLKIKNKYDPDHLLDVWQGVGWKGADDSRYTCYIDI
ncbi:FAD-binding domain-containing protein [Mycena floridula]|nr:FAD-binding domain-containing protein [Mycena floridula]